MSQRYLGGIITANPTTPTLSSASGVWTLEQDFQYSQSITPKIVGKSLRLRASASAYLNRTPATASNRKTWTWSGWVKRGALGTRIDLLGGYTGTTNGTLRTVIAFQSDDTLEVSSTRMQIATDWRLYTTQVFRDPSAWYHILVAVDTTQVTSTDRAKIYVNGVQVTAFSTATYPTQNYEGGINYNGNQYIGRYYDSGGSNIYSDGYVAETYLVDGQALTPYSFGAFDSNGVWQPLGYTGTYGTNGFYLPFNSGSSSYSASLSGSNYVTAASNAAFAVGTNNFTMETWVYPTSQAGQHFFVASNGIQMGYQNSTNWGLCQANVAWLLTTTTMPTLNQWNHLAIVRSGTGSNQTAIFLNGTRVAQGTISTSFAQNTMVIGSGIIGNQSNSRLVNGTAIYDPTQTTITVPTSPLTNVANTAILTFQNSSAIDNSSNAFTLTTTGTITYPVSSPFVTLSAIANDASGNGNNWTANNVSLAPGTTYDSMLDSPTNFNDGGTGVGNYAVLNPLQPASTTVVVPTDGNLKMTGTASGNNVTGTMAIVGSTYFEGTAVTGGGTLQFGVKNLDTGNTYVYDSNGNKYLAGTGTAYGATFTTNDIIGVAVDPTNLTLQFYKNGTSQGLISSAFPSGNYVPFFYASNTNASAANFGQRPFAYTPPTGFKALNTQNLALAAPPTITNGAKYMAATLYTGTGATQTVTNGANTTIGTTFQPDLVWTKNRGAVTNHSLVDSVRGVSLQLSSNQSIAEVTDTTQITGITSTGFSMGNSSGGGISVNTNANTYVGWQWQAGRGTTSSNTNGTITSTVSVGSTQGFSVVTYTGNGITSATVGHGLGVTPAMVIVKTRSLTYDWFVRHQSLTTGYQLRLNSTAAQEQVSTATTSGGLGTPTSTVFNFIAGASNTANVNSNGATFVAYCFAEVTGYSKFGSYTGNGSADGPFIYCGFRPRWIMFKDISGSWDWVLFDTSRYTYNAMNNALRPNTSGAEDTAWSNALDILSNGFKMRFNYGSLNTNGDTIIYAAFAENPFTISRAR